MYVDFGQIFSPVYSHANIYLKLIEAYNLLQFEVPFLYKDGLSYFSHVQLFATPLTVTYHAPLFMGFSRQGYWSGFPCPLPGDFPNPGFEPASLGSPNWQVGYLPLAPPGKPI